NGSYKIHRYLLIKRQTLNLSINSYTRYFIVGEFPHSYYSLIDLLYQQELSSKDCLILVGNFLDTQLSITEFINVISILQNNTNCYGLKGNKEEKFIQDVKADTLPYMYKKALTQEMITFIEELPDALSIDREVNIYFNIEQNQENARNVVYAYPYSHELTCGSI